VAFLRFSRDKRGVESFSLVHAAANRRGKIRPRVLYWFRTPPDIKMGREPFDPEVRRALEKQYPDITFDWRAIQETPIPSADADKWRERRRAERAAKHAARAEEESPEAVEADAEAASATGAQAGPADGDLAAASEAPRSGVPVAPPPGEGAGRPGDANRKRRRRRRSGSGRGVSASASGTPSPPPSSSEPSGD